MRLYNGHGDIYGDIYVEESLHRAEGASPQIGLNSHTCPCTPYLYMPMHSILALLYVKGKYGHVWGRYDRRSCDSALAHSHAGSLSPVALRARGIRFLGVGTSGAAAVSAGGNGFGVRDARCFGVAFGAGAGAADAFAERVVRFFGAGVSGATAVSAGNGA